MRGAPFGRRRLVLRVFAHGVVLLTLSAAIFILLAEWMIRRPDERADSSMSSVIAADTCARYAHPDPLRPVARMPVPVSVYGATNALAATSRRPALSPLDAARRRLLRAERALRVSREVSAYTCGDGYVLVGRPGAPLSASQLAVILAAVLVALVLLSLPLAWSIAAPLEDVVEVTRRFGRGELSARAGVARRDDIGDLALAFNDMAERLEASIRAEKETLANISHELRTPLARIRVVVESAQENPARAQRLLHEIATDLSDLERLVDDVMTAVRLDLSAAQGSVGALPVTLQTMDLAPLLRSAADRFEAAHPERTLRFDAPRAPLTVSGDERLLRRLVDNLLDNAEKYSEAPAPVSLRAEADAAGVSVVVEDRGVGISAEDLPRVFTPFFRGDRSRTRATGGVGLGLALARRIADAHRGQLELRSAAGVGTVATLTLPAGGALKQSGTER